jgi:hypothetical protein
LQIVKPGVDVGRDRLALLWREMFGEAVLADISQIEEIGTQLDQGLVGYDLVRLGLRKHSVRDRYYPRRLFSAIGEALRLILYTKYEPVALVGGPLGNAVYTDQAIFERRIHRVLSPGSDDERLDGPGTRWGVIFGLRDYMDQGTRNRPQWTSRGFSR